MKTSRLTPSGRRRSCYAALASVILAGVATGAVITASFGSEKTSENPWLHQYFSPMLSGETMLDVFRNTFFTAGAFAAIMFVLGFFSVGQPLCILLLAHRGLGIGSAAAQLYMENGLGAIPAVGVLVLPKAAALSMIAILGGREMLRLSGMQFAFLFRDVFPEDSMKRTTKLYCIKFAVLIILLVIISAADSSLNYFCSGLY